MPDTYNPYVGAAASAANSASDAFAAALRYNRPPRSRGSATEASAAAGLRVPERSDESPEGGLPTGGD